MSASSSEAPLCEKCGAALPVAATGGLCPRCLLAEAMSPTKPDAEPVESRKPLSPLELAPHFPQLEILECLGRGGMGVVYKARQKSLNRFVALKLLAPERVRDPQFAERFTREAQALAALNHPNIVTIHDFGQAGGFYYLLMEFVDGVNLRQAMKAARFTPEQALAIVPPVCEALQYAHEHGIVHRDIKPENLLLDKDGRVKIADFGIAKMLGTAGAGGGSGGEAVAPEHATGSVVGTPGYSAPEQKDSPQRVDSRADIYSLGVVFYEMLTGELPGKPIEPPSKKVQIDVRLDEIVLRALEKSPDRRYQTAADVKTDVETIATTPASSRGGEERTTPASTASSRVLNVCNCCMTTPERLATFDEQLFFHRNMGQLILDDRQLTFSGAGVHIVIPLAAILDLSIGRFPRVMNPVGLKSLNVTYDDGGQPKRVIIGLFDGLLGWPSHFNQLVADWFDAIRAAATAATGHAPASTPAEKLGTPSSSIRIVMMLVSLALIGFIPCFTLIALPHYAGSGPTAWWVSLEFALLSLLALYILSSGLNRKHAVYGGGSAANGAQPAAATEKIRRQVKAPAICLWLFGFFTCIAMLIDLTIPGVNKAVGPVGGGQPLLSIFLLYCLMMIGALQMRRLASFGWAVTAGVLPGVLVIAVGLFAVRWLPISLIGLPFGIWALVVLCRPEVRAAFRRRGECVPPRNLPLFVEHAGRRRLYWPGVLLFCGTLGLMVFVVNVVIALAGWLLKAPIPLMFDPGELLLVFLLMAACVVMRKAAFKLSASEAARPGTAPAAKASTTRKVIERFAVIAVAVAVAAGSALVVYYMGAKTSQPAAAPPSAPSPLSFGPAITRVVDGGRGKVIEGQGSTDSQLVFTVGGQENSWRCGFLNNSRFTAAIERPAFGRGLNCLVKDSLGNALLTLGNSEVGSMKSDRGRIVFREGTLSPEPDGSFILGEFRPETSAPLSITVRLEKPGKTSQPAPTVPSTIWSPALAPGEKPDLQRIQAEAKDLMDRTMNETSQVTYGSGSLFFVVQLLPLINILLNLAATVCCVRAKERGLALILWLLFVWLVPVIGPLVALYAVRRTMRKFIIVSWVLLAVLVNGTLLAMSIHIKSKYDQARKGIAADVLTYTVTRIDQETKALLSEVQSNWFCQANVTGGPTSDGIKLAGMTPSVRNLIRVFNYEMPEYSWLSPKQNQESVVVGMAKANLSLRSLDHTIHISEDEHLAAIRCATNTVYIFRDTENGLRESLYVRKKNNVGSLSSANAAAPRLQFRLVADANDTAPAETLADPGSKEPLRVRKEILLDESAVARASVTVSPEHGVSVDVDFNEVGAKRFSQITGANIGKRLVIVFDGKVLSAPTLRSVIHGKAVITGAFTAAEAAEAFANALNAPKGWRPTAGVPSSPGAQTKPPPATTPASAASPLSSGPVITRVVDGGRGKVIEGHGSTDSQLVFTVGGQENSWRCGFLNNSRFTAAIERPAFGRGLNCLVKDSLGNALLTLGNSEVGSMKSDRGRIVFREGTLSPEPDGSFILGEFRPETSAPVSITVRLEKLSKQTASPAEAKPAPRPAIPPRRRRQQHRARLSKHPWISTIRPNKHPPRVTRGSCCSWR